MSQSRSVLRLRARIAVLFSALYALSVLSFWVAGIFAYAEGFHGAARWLGLLYVPSLLLPFVGHGSIAGIAIGGPIWAWWFGLQLVLAAAAVWVYPHDRVSRWALVRSAVPTPSRARVSA